MPSRSGVLVQGWPTRQISRLKAAQGQCIRPGLTLLVARRLVGLMVIVASLATAR